MLSTRKVWLSLAAILAAMMTAPVSAQDFPALGADPQHTGRNANPALYGPGIANLVWFWPNGVGRPGAVVRNNTSDMTLRNGTWIQTPINEEAGFPFIAPRPTADAVLNGHIGTNSFPAYEYALSTPSALNSHDDPTTAANAAALSTFTWTVDPQQDSVGAPNGYYQLFIWLPAGPTGPIGGPAGPLYFPNRYYVVEIISGTGQRTVDIIDTTLSGQGWVRLGNGGRPTNAVFPYQGVPITIRLYNTEWRDEFNNLLEGFNGDDQRVVYADAVMAVPDNGYYTAGPIVKQIDTGGGGLRTQVVASRNVNSAVIQNGATRTVTTSEVAAFFHDGSGPSSNAPIWRWSPVESSPNTTTLDNSDPGVTSDPGWTLSNVTNHFGANYLTRSMVTDPATATFVTYTPSLEDGDYLIQVYVGGDSGTEFFAHQMTVYVTESDGTVSQIPIDASVPGWITLSNQRFRERTALGNLRVQISNYSPNAADATRTAYADEVRFIGSFNLQVNSTPAMARATIRLAGGGTADKDVVIVTSDDGHIYCLDATGNGNGTTTVYWAYPSILPSGVNDPNDAANEDGVGIRAEMPTDAGFGTSSPVVARIGTTDYCYIAARNGRVYSIEMEGRGDYNAATGQIGTTSRKWSWPDDYPALRRPGLSAGFGGSVAYAESGGVPTLYVPALEGRMYALNATGLFNRTTDIRWNYPSMNAPTLGALTTNPTVDFGNVYFGTARASDFTPGQFYSLNANTGALNWVFEGDATNDVEADVFSGGPCTATAAQLGIANNMVFCSNQNLRIYGLDADTGALLWRTAELNTTVTAPLTFNVMAVPNLVGTVVAEPLVMVPSDTGRFDALFARPAVINVDNGRLAWEYVAGSDSVLAPMSVGWNFMYGADMSGNLYAWGNIASIGGMGPPPGNPSLPPNDVNTAPYRNSKVKLITKQAYQRLRDTDPADATGLTAPLTKAQALAMSFNRTPLAFEWGETAYFLVYDFPTPDPGEPTLVQFQLSVEGSALRSFGVMARKFEPAGDPLEGFAVLAFPLNTGPTSIPPGDASLKYSFTIDNPANPGQGQQVNVPITATFPFKVLNPLGLIMPIPGTKSPGIGTQTFGINSGPTSFGDLERIRNGTPNMIGGTQGQRVANTEGVVGNGQTGVGSFYVVDMSMMTLLRGISSHLGITNVRMNRVPLGWQGGAFAVLKPIDQLMYPGYEDLPVNHPNRSLDYPDIGRENIRGTKDPNGATENMTLAATGVTLSPPIIPSNYDDSMLTTRKVVPVLCLLEVDVPRFQPANNDQSRYFTDSSGNSLASGYLGRVSVFVDANGNNVLDSISGRREPYRAFMTNIAVALDQRLDVTTPTVDLGTLAEGTGYSPFRPTQGGAGTSNTFSPWIDSVGVVYPLNTIVSNNPDYVNVFQPFEVENLGNVNLLNVRVATGVTGGQFPGPWPIYSNSVDDLGWLDAREYVYTNFDYLFGLMPQVLLQKARVGDRFPTELTTNPIRRLNQNLGVVEALLFPNGPIGTAAAPRVGATPPIGMPVGMYSQRMEVIEDTIPFGASPLEHANLDVSTNAALNYPALESYSDPTFTLKFIVREARATTAFTKATSPMVDVPQPSPNTLNLTYANQQPGGYRTPAGDLVMAFTSSRANFNDPMPATPIVDPRYRIYIATLNGQPASNSFGSPLGELGYATPTGNQWFRQAAGPFPNLGNYDALFQSGAGENVIAGSEKFGAPAFPAYGVVNPLGGQNFGSTIMAFIGTAQKQTSNGRNSESRIMTANVTVANDGSTTVDNLQAMPFDPNTTKTKPSVYQVAGGAAILYSASGTGEGQLFYTAFNGSTFSRPTVIPVGSGFEEVGAPNAQPRLFANSSPIVELTFVGKLRGRPNSEVFYGRLGTRTDNGVGNMPGQALILPVRLKEDLTPDAEQGTYRAQGVVWDTRPNATLKVYESLDGINNIDLEPVGAVRTVDRATGLIRFDTKLGGQVYIDPNLGTVRFASSLPPKNAVIRLDYAPRFLRVSESTVAGHAGPTLLWDDRIAGDISNTSYWFKVASDGSVSNVDPVNALPKTARFFYTYTRAAAGAGQAARPYWKTMRLGVKLKNPIYTDQAGNVVGLNISGLAGNNDDLDVQVDPVHGMIFFQSRQENIPISVSYSAVDASGMPFAVQGEPQTIGIVTERSETAVPIDQAINEGWMTAFIDPFDLNPRRPGLIWMYFSSTRAGGNDIYFQAMAPRFTPVLKR